MAPFPILGERPYGKRDGRVLLVTFFDPNGINTIIESIHAWQFHSRYEVVVANLWPGGQAHLSLPASIRLNEYDTVVVHPTVSYHAHNLASLDRNLARGFSEYDGVKLLMKQDEQVATAQFVNFIREKKFDIVLTCVPPNEHEKVYPRALIGECELVQVLTGYVTPAMRRGYPQATRDIDISYRGSIQPLEFGRLGYEKRGIGYDVSRVLAANDLRIDISSRWEDRVLGEHWTRFLSRSRAVLGTESGSNLFDFDGKVAEWCRAYEIAHRAEDPASEQYYRVAHEAYLHGFEGNVLYGQISPRHFEAAAAGAAQILYEGDYSGIFQARRHFMPLRRDSENLPEVVDFIRDEAARARMVERAFEEVILDRRNWYENVVAEADAAIERKRATKGKVSIARDRGVPSASPSARPVAYLLVAHDPVLDPRIDWMATSLAKSYEVYVIGTYDFGGDADGPSFETAAAGYTIVRVQRSKHNAAWVPSASQIQAGLSLPRAVLATLAGFSVLPDGILAERIGAHGAPPEAVARFREFCTYFVNTNSALIQAADNMGAPDLVAAADLDTLPSATAIAGGAGCYCVYDAHEFWPFAYTDFRHWEVEFWLGIDRLLSPLANLRVTVSEQLATIMTRRYGCEFITLPNCAGLAEGEAFDLKLEFARREVPAALKVLFLGNFAEGRGLEETIRAFAHVESNAQLILQGRDNSYRDGLIQLAASLGIGEDRVSFPPAVSEAELVETAAKADVGLIPYNPAYFGYRYCCPNKLSQYLAAGLPIVSSSTEYVASVVTREKIGHVVDISNPVSFAELIDDLSNRREELVHLGRRARRFFEERYHWEAVATPVLAKVEDALRGQSRRTSRIDLEWTAEAASRYLHHGQAGTPSVTMFGVAPVTVSETQSGVEQDSNAASGSSGVSRSNKWLRRAWRLIPTSVRYPIADWLRRNVS